jgi:hypothetical protein
MADPVLPSGARRNWVFIALGVFAAVYAIFFFDIGGNLTNLSKASTNHAKCPPHSTSDHGGTTRKRYAYEVLPAKPSDGAGSHRGSSSSSSRSSSSSSGSRNSGTSRRPPTHSQEEVDAGTTSSSRPRDTPSTSTESSPSTVTSLSSSHAAETTMEHLFSDLPVASIALHGGAVNYMNLNNWQVRFANVLS